MGGLDLFRLRQVVTYLYQHISLRKYSIRGKIKILTPALANFATKRGGGVNLRPVPTAGVNFEFETIP